MAAAGSEREPSLRVLVPPLNFGLVAPGIYRSGFPVARNFSFLRTLRLRAVVYLGTDVYVESTAEFLREEGIALRSFALESNKEPFLCTSTEEMARALAFVLDPVNQPVLVHCTKGTHRTGCFVGSLRKVMQWSLGAALDEYRKFASRKGKILDEQFIEMFDEKSVEFPHRDVIASNIPFRFIHGNHER